MGEKIIGLFWDALKEKCCSDPAEAKRCVMVSEDAFRDAFNSALTAHGLAIVPRTDDDMSIKMSDELTRFGCCWPLDEGQIALAPADVRGLYDGFIEIIEAMIAEAGNGI